MFLCRILTEKSKPQVCMMMCCQPVQCHRMKSLNFHGLIRSHSQANILISCELQLLLCVSSILQVMRSTFSQLLKQTHRRKTRSVHQTCTFCLRERQWKVRYCSTASGRIAYYISIFLAVAFEVQEDIFQQENYSSHIKHCFKARCSA